MKKLIAIFFSAVFVLSGGVSLAEETRNQKSDPEIVVADVSVYDASLVSQEGNILKIAFNIKNKKGTQSEIKYAIELQKVDTEKEKKESDGLKVYDEIVTLGENEAIHREVTYTAPDYLKGKYRILVRSQNKKGLPLGIALAGEVFLDGTGQFIHINPSSCVLLVAKGTESKKLSEFVETYSDQEITIQCKGISHFKNSVVGKPVVKVTTYSAFGDPAGENGGEGVIFLKEKEQVFKITVPKENKAQVYQISLVILNDQGASVSNSIIARFSVKGHSASILNVLSDKDKYSKNDTASLSLFWNRREGIQKIFANVSLISGQVQCADPFRKEIGMDKTGGLEVISLPIISDCQGGEIVFTLTDEDGEVLDESKIVLNADQNKLEVPVSNQKQSRFSLPYIIAIAILLVGVLLIVIRRKNTDHAKRIFLFFGVLLTIFGFSGKGVGATTYCNLNNRVCITNVLNNNIEGNDETSYCSGDTIYGATEVWTDGSFTGGQPSTVKMTINNITQSYSDVYDGYSGYNYYLFWWQDETIFQPPTDSGSYYALFENIMKDRSNETYYSNRNISYKIEDCDTEPIPVQGNAPSPFCDGAVSKANWTWAPDSSPLGYAVQVDASFNNFASNYWSWDVPRDNFQYFTIVNGWNNYNPAPSLEYNKTYSARVYYKGTGAYSPTYQFTAANCILAPTITPSCAGGVSRADISWMPDNNYDGATLQVDPLSNDFTSGNYWSWPTGATSWALTDPWNNQQVPHPSLAYGKEYPARVYYNRLGTYGPTKLLTAATCPPIISLAASPNPVNAGNSTTLSWSNSGGNPTACYAACYRISDGARQTCSGFDNSVGNFSFNAGAFDAGTWTTQVLQEDMRYDVTCCNNGGCSEPKANVTVNCSPACVSGTTVCVSGNPPACNETNCGNTVSSIPFCTCNSTCGGAMNTACGATACNANTVTCPACDSANYREVQP